MTAYIDGIMRVEVNDEGDIYLSQEYPDSVERIWIEAEDVERLIVFLRRAAIDSWIIKAKRSEASVPSA